jgi:hypothetical protein
MNCSIALHEAETELVTFDERAHDVVCREPDHDARGSREAVEEIKRAAETHHGSWTTQRRTGREFKGGHQYGGGHAYEVIETVTLTFASTAGAAACLRLARTLLLEWMRNKRERSVEITVGDRKIVVKGDGDVQAAITAFEKLDASEPDPPSGH